MKIELNIAATFLAVGASFASAAFVDDLGFEHQKVDNPKLVLSAQLAVSLHHMGKSCS